MTVPQNPRPLTTAEIETIRLIARGYTNEAIVELLNVKMATLKARIQAVNFLLGTELTGGPSPNSPVMSRVRLVIWAYESELIEPNSADDDRPKSKSRTVEHGTYAGWQQHKRVGNKACEPCQAAKRGYDVGRRHGNAQGRQAAAANKLAARALQVCRDVIYRRPWPLIRAEAVAVIREADDELMAEELPERTVAAA